MTMRARVVARFLDKKAEEFDLLKELTRERTPEEVERYRIGTIRTRIANQLGVIINDIVRPPHPGPRTFVTQKGKWPGKGWKNGDKGRAVSRLNMDGVKGDIPSDYPASVFFDFKYDKDGRWYTALGYTTTGGRDKVLAKGPMNSFDRIRDAAKKHLVPLFDDFRKGSW